MPCSPARNAPGNRSLVESVGMSIGDSNFLLLAADFRASPLALLALRCSPALWPLGSLRESSATGIANRSAVQPRSLRLNWLAMQTVLPLGRFHALRLRTPSGRRGRHSPDRP